MLVAIATAFAIGNLRGEQSERRDASPHEHAESAKSSARRACVGVDLSATFDCIYEHVERSEEQAHTEQDLTAQQDTARWTMLMLFVGAITSIISVVGLWLIRETLRETRVMARESSAAARAAMRSARSSREANKFARDTAKRAYLAVSKLAVTSLDDKIIAAEICIENYGATPARITSIFHKAWGGPETQIDPQSSGPAMQGYYHFRPILPPRSPSAIDVYVNDPAEIALARSGKGQLYFYGKIDYEDIYGNAYWLKWAFRNDGRAVVTPGTFSNCIYGNDGT
jgi:hypothetical protein